MAKGVRIFNCLKNTMPVFDMALKITNPRVKDIAEGVFPQE